jgi:hypothetical protein
MRLSKDFSRLSCGKAKMNSSQALAGHNQRGRRLSPDGPGYGKANECGKSECQLFYSFQRVKLLLFRWLIQRTGIPRKGTDAPL